MPGFPKFVCSLVAALAAGSAAANLSLSARLSTAAHHGSGLLLGPALPWSGQPWIFMVLQNVLFFLLRLLQFRNSKSEAVSIL